MCKKPRIRGNDIIQLERALIMNEANLQTNKGAFKCWRTIASCYQYAIPSKAPFPLMERHFPTNLIKTNTDSLLLILQINKHL